MTERTVSLTFFARRHGLPGCRFRTRCKVLSSGRNSNSVVTSDMQDRTNDSMAFMKCIKRAFFFVVEQSFGVRLLQPCFGSSIS